MDRHSSKLMSIQAYLKEWAPKHGQTFEQAVASNPKYISELTQLRDLLPETNWQRMQHYITGQ